MTQKVKIYGLYRPGDKGTEMEEVDIQEAEKILAEAMGTGRLVIDRKRGEVITEMKPDVEEVLIVDIMEGG